MCLHCYSISLLFDILSTRLDFLAFILHCGASGILYKFLASRFIFPSFSLPLPLPPSFIQNYFFEHLLYPRHHSRVWEYRHEQKPRKSPAMELALSWQLWLFKTIDYNPCSWSFSLFSMTKCFSLMRIYLSHQPGSATKDTKRRCLILPTDAGDLFLVFHFADLKHTFLTETLE